jgi:hypothetical protein
MHPVCIEVSCYNLQGGRLPEWFCILHFDHCTQICKGAVGNGLEFRGSCRQSCPYISFVATSINLHLQSYRVGCKVCFKVMHPLSQNPSPVMRWGQNVSTTVEKPPYKFGSLEMRDLWTWALYLPSPVEPQQNPAGEFERLLQAEVERFVREDGALYAQDHHTETKGHVRV